MNSDDRYIFISLVAIACIAFLASAVLSVGIIAQSVERVIIVYFPAFPLAFGQVMAVILITITLFFAYKVMVNFVYKLISKRWYYDYKMFENDVREYHKDKY